MVTSAEEEEDSHCQYAIKLASASRISTAYVVESSHGSGYAGDHKEGWTRGTSLPFRGCIPPPRPQPP